MDIIDEEDVGMSKSELKEEVKRLKLQLQLLQSGHGDAGFFPSFFFLKYSIF